MSDGSQVFFLLDFQRKSLNVNGFFGKQKRESEDSLFYRGTQTRGRTGMEVNPLVFETSASTDSAIWAFALRFPSIAVQRYDLIFNLQTFCLFFLKKTALFFSEGSGNRTKFLSLWAVENFYRILLISCFSIHYRFLHSY